MMDRASVALRLRVFLISALALFVEMLLVRWLGTELRIFAYVQNAVLVTAFLGLGLGSLDSRRPARLLPAVVCLALLALVIRDPFRWEVGEAVSQGLAAFPDSIIWYTMATPPVPIRTALVCFSVVVTLLLLAAVALVFRPLGQLLGAWVDQDPQPIAAYTANILGSLVGIAGFVALTVLEAPPWTWLVASTVGVLTCFGWFVDRGWQRLASAVLVVVVPLVAWSGRSPAQVWSPYQKLELGPGWTFAQLPDGSVTSCGEAITVNNVLYQAILDLDPDHWSSRPDLYPPDEIPTSHYVLPHRLVGPRDRALVVGSGAGNDVAAALAAGVRRVDAVEIDPSIVRLGRERHPNRPYSSPAVRVTVDDARAAFRLAPEGAYDLVWFGLLDSHTTPSAWANVRLDHFVYTRESFEAMRRLLSPSGVVVLLFEARTEWIAARLFRLLEEAFDHPPLAVQVRASRACLGYGGLLLVGGSSSALAPVEAAAEADGGIRVLITSLLPDAEVTTDDWPYLYLPYPTIPRYHLLVGLAAIVVAFVLRRQVLSIGEPVDPVMMLLGAGFMLLEVTAVCRAALLFGTTWTVNAYVVGAILALILLANLMAWRFDPRVDRWPAAGLVTSLLLLSLVPTDWLAGLGGPSRIVAGGGFLALPVLFSGLIFIGVFVVTPRKDVALGSNLLGALVGGVASMLSMVIGFRDLTLLTLAVYLVALVLIVRRRAAGHGPAPQS